MHTWISIKFNGCNIKKPLDVSNNKGDPRFERRVPIIWIRKIRITLVEMTDAYRRRRNCTTYRRRDRFLSATGSRA